MNSWSTFLERNIGVEKYFSQIVIKTVIDGDNVLLKYLMTDQPGG